MHILWIIPVASCHYPLCTWFHKLPPCARFTASPSVGGTVQDGQAPRGRASQQHPGQGGFTLPGVSSHGARGQPPRSRAHCGWSPCAGQQLRSWPGTVPAHCYLGLREKDGHKGDKGSVSATGDRQTAVTCALGLQPSQPVL